MLTTRTTISKMSTELIDGLESAIAKFTLNEVSAIQASATWFDDLEGNLGDLVHPTLPRIVFRAASDTSRGSTGSGGMKAGIYKDWPFEKIPNAKEISRPGHENSYSEQEIIAETLAHLDKHQKEYTTVGGRTGWISTTSSLLRALKILFVEHAESIYRYAAKMLPARLERLQIQGNDEIEI
ncbi:hypothetical protein IFR05_017494 [Cadophora sp. M221]|nr:hypothetical protein IFR05_017494 [Cadophora sp. M221]